MQHNISAFLQLWPFQDCGEKYSEETKEIDLVLPGPEWFFQPTIDQWLCDEQVGGVIFFFYTISSTKICFRQTTSVKYEYQGCLAVTKQARRIFSVSATDCPTQLRE